MDRRGGCCIARYAGGAYDVSKMDRIMLRFRPIAPKPASGSGSTTPENSGGASVKTGRGKRRYVAKDANNNSSVSKKNNRKRRKCSPEKTDSGGSVTGGKNNSIKTLPLLPETPDVKEAPKRQRFPLWLSFENGGGDRIGADPVRRVAVGSWVRVECVTDTWLAEDGCGGYGGILGRTDEERVRNLDLDACPGFVSDGLNRVRWTNAAYRRTVAGEGAVVVEGAALTPVGSCGAGFTCRVRVVTCGKEKASKTVPCDVWRMECGGFAWRLDTTAALSLGR